MSFNFDASGIGQLALRLGLVSEAQVRECLDELDDRKAPAEALVRLMERKRYLSPWQGAKLLKGDTDGYFLGGYRILYKIASGSFGRVYRGDDPRTGQVVAIKVLRNKWTLTQQKIDLFLREGRLGMTIRHPNIVSVLAVDQDAQTGQYYIVMEFIEGGNLRDILTGQKKLPPPVAVRYIEECGQGLAYAYSRGLTHRDIKPSNILIDAKSGQAKLVDFGLAEMNAATASVFLQRQDERDEEVAVDRTVDYAGLERATNQKPGDIRSDIYFLGAVLYECVTGQPVMPVTKDRLARMQPRRYQEVEDTLYKQGPALGVPPPVMTVLGKMLAFDPAKRYQTPQEMVEALTECRHQLGEPAGPPSKVGLAPPTAASRTPPGPPTICVVEANPKLQEAFRTLNRKGYRVIVSVDPGLPVRQYQAKPFHALIVDCGTVGKDGLDTFNQILKQSDEAHLDLAAVAILNEDQAGWRSEARAHPRGAVMVRPVGLKEVLRKLRELVPALAPEVEQA